MQSLEIINIGLPAVERIHINVIQGSMPNFIACSTYSVLWVEEVILKDRKTVIAIE